MIVSMQEKTRLDIPHEQGQWIEVRPLSWVELQEAAKARQREAIKSAADIPGEVYDRLSQVHVDNDQVPGDVASAYDMRTVLHDAVTGWSYGVEPTPEYIDQLDERTAEWLFHKVIDANLRSHVEGEV